MNSDSIQVQSESSLQPEAQALLKGLYDELNVLFADYGGEEGDATMPPLDFRLHEGEFVIARIDGVAVGCAGFRRFDAETAEVKRVFVSEAARGRGVARALMRDLEERARAMGYRRLVLETSTRQPAAMRLYESLGYAAVPNYGQYADHPLTCCYAKQLFRMTE